MAGPRACQKSAGIGHERAGSGSAPEGVEAEGVIPLVVQIVDGILKEGLLLAFVQVGVEDELRQDLQPLVGNLLVLNQIKDRLLPGVELLQVKRQFGLFHLGGEVGQGILRGLFEVQAHFAGQCQQHFTELVDLSFDVVFHRMGR